MGKVYEALKKASGEGKSAGWSAVSVTDPPKQRRSENNDVDSELDFIEYSLNAADAYEIEHKNREAAEAEVTRKSLIQPANEVTLDISRIAPQLVSFHGSNTDAAEEYNKLAVTLITTARERPAKRVLVTSAQRG